MSLSPAQKQQLAERIDALAEELRDALQQREAAGETVELDQTRQGRLSRMDAMQAQAMAQAAAGRARAQLSALERTRTSLAGEDFGLCEECDEPIAFARLQLDPCVRLCIACAEAAE